MNFSNEKSVGKNFTGITVVVLLHVLVAYGIVTGLGTRMVTKMAEVVETTIVEEAAPPAPQAVPAPPPPPPEMKAPPPPFIPPVEINVQQPPPVVPVIANVSTVKPVSAELPKALPAAPAPLAPPAPPAPPAKSIKTAAVANFNTCAKPEWPRSSLRNEETGTVTLAFVIGIDGSVVESKVTKSSGFRELDKAAVNAISRCVFKPGTTDGKPEQSSMQMQYVWTLE